MQKYRMLKTVHGVREGKLHPEQFSEGETHPIDDSLADQFIELGAVELAHDGAEPEEKSQGDAPANKMKKAAPENKSKKAD